MIRQLCTKYKDILAYGFFGVCTTLVNTLVYWVCAHPLSMAVLPSAVAAWFLAVLFAYVTNRKWVFHSEALTPGEIRAELVRFYSCRIATGVVDWLCMFVFVDLLHWNDLVIKLSANVLVIVLNYIASKLLIFRKHG